MLRKAVWLMGALALATPIGGVGAYQQVTVYASDGSIEYGTSAKPGVTIAVGVKTADGQCVMPSISLSGRPVGTERLAVLVVTRNCALKVKRAGRRAKGELRLQRPKLHGEVTIFDIDPDDFGDVSPQPATPYGYEYTRRRWSRAKVVRVESGIPTTLTRAFTKVEYLDRWYISDPHHSAMVTVQQEWMAAVARTDRGWRVTARVPYAVNIYGDYAQWFATFGQFDKGSPTIYQHWLISDVIIAGNAQSAGHCWFSNTLLPFGSTYRCEQGFKTVGLPRLL